MPDISNIQLQGTNGQTVSYQIKDAKAVRYFDNVSSLKSANNIQDGILVKTKGFYNLNDGGSAFYYITNENLTADDKFILSLQKSLKAVLIIENNIVNIRQLGAQSFTTTDLSRHDIAPFITAYINKLKENPNNKLSLYIPSGYWCCSPIKIENQTGFKIFGDFAYISYRIAGTVITAYDNPQTHIFQIGSENQETINFELENITFTSCSPFVSDDGKLSLQDNTMKTITDSALVLKYAIYGKINNVFFNHVAGNSLSICSCWELIFGTIGFMWCNGFSNGIIRFKTTDKTLNENANISAVCFENVYVEGTRGHIFNLEVNNGLVDSIINNIFFEPNTTDIFGGDIGDLPNTGFNDDTSTKWALFDIKGQCGLTVNNINLNNFAWDFLTVNGTQYVYDTLIKIENTTNNTAQPNLSINHINVQGMHKTSNLIYQKNAEMQKNSMVSVNSINNLSAYNLRYNVDDFPIILSNARLFNARNSYQSITPNAFEFWKNIKTNENKLCSLCYDEDCLNTDKLALKPITTVKGQAFTYLIATSNTLKVRAKIENGKTYNLSAVLNDGSFKNVVTNLVGTGSYKIYTINLSTLETDLETFNSLYLATSSTQTDDIDVSLDYAYFI